MALKKTFSSLIRIVVGFGILAVILLKTDIFRLWNILKHINLLWFIGAMAAYFTAILLSSVRWDILLRPKDIKVKIWPIMKIYLTSLFLANILPSGAGLDAARGVFMAKATKQTADSLASVVIDRIFGFIGLILLVLFGIPLKLSGVTAYRNIALLIAAVLIVGTMASMTRPVFAFVNLVLRRIPYGDKLLKLYQAFYTYRTEFKVIPAALGLSVIIQLFLALQAWFCAAAIGYSLPLAEVVVYVPAINLIMAIPVSVGGIGLREGGFVVFFSEFSKVMPREAALTLGILYGISALIVTLLGAYFLIHSRNGED